MTDRDFQAPVPQVRVTIVELELSGMTTDQGNYVLPQVPAGTYTLVFAKSGYIRQVRANVVVTGGRLTEVNVALSGDFTDMEEFVVQDPIQIGGGSEAALLDLRLSSASLMTSIGSDQISRAGASDAASALRLVAGATVRDGSFAVIRGLPDRYVSSQLNGVRLPSADIETRAVELDQFPATLIDSIRVSKTFTPDQQGDASGGAVDVRLKGIPDEPLFFRFNGQFVSVNSNVKDRNDFLSYDGGGVNYFGRDQGSRNIQNPPDRDWEGAVGTSTRAAPNDYGYSLSGGGSYEFDNGVRVGGSLSYFYERDSEFYNDGVNEEWVVLTSSPALTPQLSTYGTPNFRTFLFDTTRAVQSVQWGLLGLAGLEIGGHKFQTSFLRSSTTEDEALLNTDTRGKEFFFAGYDPNDPDDPGNSILNENSAPYRRNETLRYTERLQQSLIFSGEHPLGTEGFGPFGAPSLSWTYADSKALRDEPDERNFSTEWIARQNRWRGVAPAGAARLGNLQRIYERVEETSDQYSIDLDLPFEQWEGLGGSFKFGVFDDQVERQFTQETFANSRLPGQPFGPQFYDGGFNQPWSAVFPFQFQPLNPSLQDIDYRGFQDIQAVYAMVDLPVAPWLNVISGVRWQSTDIEIDVLPEPAATWFPNGIETILSVNPDGTTDADVDTARDDALPAASFIANLSDTVTFRGSYAETIALQTFRELSPVLQREFVGGPIFIGNPDLESSEVSNYDARIDWTPAPGTLLSASYFYKDLNNPIEFIRLTGGGGAFSFISPTNYVDGVLQGVELEARTDLGEYSESLSGLSVGANATFISSEVTRPQSEIDAFNVLGFGVAPTRDATQAPEFLYNLSLTYDLPTNTQLGLFYTVTGDTLVAGSGVFQADIEDLLTPAIYAKEFDNLNFTLGQRINDYLNVRFQAKNLTNPDIDTEFRSPAGEARPNSSFTRGIEYSISIGGEVIF